MIEWLHRLLLENLPLKGIALTLSVVVFLVSHGHRQGAVTLDQPLQVAVPEGFVLQGTPPSSARVQLRGRRDVLQSLQAQGLKPLQVAADAREGTQQLNLIIAKEGLPAEVEVLGVQPSHLTVSLDPLVSVAIPIITRHRMRGDLPSGLRLGAVRSDPPQAIVSGPRSHVERLRDLSPGMVDLTGRRASFSEPRALSLPAGLDLRVEPAEVIVQVEILARSQSMRLGGVTVRALNLARPHTLTPAQIDLLLLGTPEALAAVNPDQILIAFDASQEQDSPPRDTPYRVLPEHIFNLPEGVTLDEARLPTVLLRTQPAPPPPEPPAAPPTELDPAPLPPPAPILP